MNWKEAKSFYLSMPKIIKRTEYDCGNEFKTVNDIVDWGIYVRTDEGRTRLEAYFAEKEAYLKNKKTQTDASVTSKKDALDENKGVDKLLARADGAKMEVKRTSKAGDQSTADEVPAKIVKAMRETSSTDESSGSGECQAGDGSKTTKESVKMEMESVRETASPDGSSESESTTTEDTVKTEVEVKNERISTLSKATDKSTTTDDVAKMANAGEGEPSTSSKAVVAAQPKTEKKFPKNDVVNSKVSLFIGDITFLEIDAIVNAANTVLLCGGGVDKAIHLAAGYDHLRAECAALKDCKIGDAKITGGYKLPAKYIIHAVGPKGEFPDELRSSYKKSMDLLKEHELETIAFPCISTGVFEYRNEEAAMVALETIRNWLDEDEYAAKVKRVIFCLFLQDDIDIYHKLMPKYFPFE
ncbi:ganglioside-induced differentiation-associated-protein 2-like [Bradysia coprophila]|uniref:ganglioside-induced differentiation-associated-protein 2-like n=1 Tax=Bradysia coprophila TaxID=38358 RepID=UPI00187DD06A|nr:ganglioside-induced differentiation-associated-protein 2-like [Bradysia coprophila]